MPVPSSASTITSAPSRSPRPSTRVSRPCASRRISPRDASVAAVRAAAADDRDDARAGNAASTSSATAAPARCITRSTSRVTRLGRAHLLGGVERLSRASLPTATAAASSRECVIESSIVAAPTAAARAAMPPAQPHAGFGRPTISISLQVKWPRRSRAPSRPPPCRRNGPRSAAPGSAWSRSTRARPR